MFPVRYLIRSLPEPISSPVAAPDVSTPVKRGAYLVTVGACGDCHSRNGVRFGCGCLTQIAHHENQQGCY